MKISPWVLNRLEELDIVILDRRGNPIAFTKNFSIFIDSYLVEQEQTRQFGDIVRDLFKTYTVGKTNKGDNIKLYVKIIAEILTYISQNSDVDSVEEFRIETMKRLHL